MVILPRLRCPGCGRTIHAAKAKVVPPAEKYEDCLRRCTRCKIGATNAKNLAKVRFIYAAGRPENAAPDEAQLAEQRPPTPEQQEAQPAPAERPAPDQGEGEPPAPENK